MPRDRLKDEQWRLIADLFPEPKATGRPRRDRRVIVDAVLWVLRTGAPWRDLPEVYGPWATAWDLFNKWNSNGLLVQILQRLQGMVKINEEVWCVDGSVVRAARCAAGGGKRGTPTSRRTTRWDAVAAV